MRLKRVDAMQLAWPVAAALCGSVAFGLSGAAAKTVQVPATQPQVSLDVPDDWTVLPVGNNFELSSPDKTSIVIVGIVKRTKADVTAWHNMATSKMVAFGIKFDPKAVAPPPAQKAAEAKPAKPAAPSLASLGIAAPKASAPTTTSLPAGAGPDAATAAPTVFSGAPTIAGPEKPPAVETAKDQEPEPAFSLDQFNAAASPKIEPHMTFRAAFLYGATLDGKPVDAQFFNFGLSKDAAFLLQQESTPTDNRAVDIAKSVRRAS